MCVRAAGNNFRIRTFGSKTRCAIKTSSPFSLSLSLSLPLSPSPKWFFPFPLCGRSHKKKKKKTESKSYFPTNLRRFPDLTPGFFFFFFVPRSLYCLSFSHAAFTRRPLIQSNSYSREIIIYRRVLSMCLKKKKK